MEVQNNDLVSIIMLSKNNGRNVVDSVKSVQVQTYTNWELLFIDDSSKDETLDYLMVQMRTDKRFKVSNMVNGSGLGANRLNVIKQANGRWLAFLDTGDVWEPTKLERQIAFMKEHDYLFSYTKYRIMDEKQNVEYEMSGPAVLTNEEMRKCYWAGCLTIMCEASLIHPERINVLNVNNDYALWLKVSEEANCYLLDECLASNWTERSFIKRLPLANKLKWRYEVYRHVERNNAIMATILSLQNMYYSIAKQIKYKKRL